MFDWLRKKSRWTAAADRLYAECVRAGREPLFYQDFGVPDTLDGRFDMIVLHVALMIRRLSRERLDGRDLSQVLFDRLFVDMDRSVREIGVGDLSVARHVRRMMEAFNGRLARYDRALTASDRVALREALKDNIYGTIDAPPADGLTALTLYTRVCARILDSAEMAAFVRGEVRFTGLTPREPLQTPVSSDETQEERRTRPGMVANG
jgi:cytochrome b pre-mRNA-processing protein 3